MKIKGSDRVENVGYAEALSLGFQLKTTNMDLHMSSPTFCEIIQKTAIRVSMACVDIIPK